MSTQYVQQTVYYTRYTERMSCLQIYKLLTLVSWRALGFWNIVSFTMDSLLTAAFAIRIAGIATINDQAQSDALRYLSFQCLSFAAPLLWMSKSEFWRRRMDVILTRTQNSSQYSTVTSKLS